MAHSGDAKGKKVRKAEAIRLYRLGCSTTQIALRLGVCYGTVRNYLCNQPAAPVDDRNFRVGYMWYK